MCRCFIITSYLNGDLLCILDKNKEDFIICADNGYAVARNNGIVPNIIIGDFDSIEIDFPSDVEILQLPVEKDVTDTLACVKYAINKGFKEIIIIGGIGGRLDHTMANLQCLLYGISLGVNIELRDNNNIATIHFPSEIIIKKKENFKLSLFSFSDICSGISTKGLKYQLFNDKLFQGFPLGISNEFTAEYASVSFGSGILLLILSKD
ncbi:MAG: thiamine diphosphokinase [Peptostreptococcaceae bacterium]|nr:thiamine diphosphokinase [Peptostreptococcaceae bacterium]